MTEKQILEHCKQLLEKKINKGNSSNWSDKDFSEVSDKIYESTTVRLSVSSLKRIFGRIKYSSSPQRETKNALVRFLGYNDWDAFSEFVINDSFHPSFKQKLLSNYKIVLPITIVLLIIVSYVWLSSLSQIEVKIDKDFGTAPFQAIIKYQIKGFFNKNAYQINFDEFLNNYDKFQLPFEKNTITNTYHFGDVYNVQIYKNQDTVTTMPVVVETKGWQHILSVFNAPAKYIPLSPEENFSLNSILYISPDIVARHGIDTLNKYWIKHRYIKNFDLDGNNFNLQVRARIKSKLNGIDCPEIDIAVPGLKHKIKFKTFYPGCGSIENIAIFGEKVFDGTYTDLSNFGFDITNWTNILLSVRDKQVEVSFNDSIVYTTSFNEDVGNVQGVLLNTLRSAEIDFIKFSDQEGNIVFVDDF